MNRQVFAASLFALFLVGCSLATNSRIQKIDLNQPAQLPPLPADGEAYPLLPPSAERGEAIYEQKCAACHGINGAGDGARAAQIKLQGKQVANLTNVSRARTVKPSEWHGIITAGRIQNLMPPFGGASGSLNAQQRWDVQAYLWALGTQTQSLQTGRDLYTQNCALCHGANGEGSPTAPNFVDGRFIADNSLLDISNKMIRGDVHKNVQLIEDPRYQVAHAVRAFGHQYADPAKLRFAKANGAGSITLRVANGTPGGNSVIVSPITLRALNENGEVFSRTANLDGEGTATFSNLPQRNNYFYQAEVDYGGGRFYGAPAQLFTTTQTISDVLAVYETTNDASGIRIGSYVIAIQDVKEGEITLVEIYQFDNTSNRAYIGENGRILTIVAPKDARNLRFDGLGLGKRFFQDDETIYDTDLVVPGQAVLRITMIYELPYRNGQKIERRVFYPVDAFNVFAPQTNLPGTQLSVNGMKDEGEREAGSSRIRLYSSEKPFKPNDVVSFELQGQPRGTQQAGEDTQSLVISLIALASTIGLGFLFLTRANSIRAQNRSPRQTRKSLLLQIAELDDEFAVGEISASEYEKRRADLKERLKAFWD
jgi:mono/diheme cytochrome c family protein